MLDTIKGRPAEGDRAAAGGGWKKFGVGPDKVIDVPGAVRRQASTNVPGRGRGSGVKDGGPS